MAIQGRTTITHACMIACLSFPKEAASADAGRTLKTGRGEEQHKKHLYLLIQHPSREQIGFDSTPLRGMTANWLGVVSTGDINSSPLGPFAK